MTIYQVYSFCISYSTRYVYSSTLSSMLDMPLSVVLTLLHSIVTSAMQWLITVGIIVILLAEYTWPKFTITFDTYLAS